MDLPPDAVETKTTTQKRWVLASVIAGLFLVTLTAVVILIVIGTEQTTPVPAPSTQATTSVPPKLASAPSDEPVDASPAILATISGIVVDGWGEGVTGSIVTATKLHDGAPTPVGTLGVVPGPIPPIPPIQKASQAGSSSAIAGVVAGTDGRFTLRVDSPAIYHLSSFYPSHLSASLGPITVAPGVHIRDVILVAYRQPNLDAGVASADAGIDARPITGRVFDPGGGGLPGVRILVVKPKDPSSATLSDASGRFRLLTAPNATLRLHHPDYPDITVSTKIGKAVDVRFSYGGGLDGQVRDAHSLQTIAAARVIATMETHKRRAATTEKGVFIFPALRPGRWTISVRAKGYTPLVSKVNIAAGTTPGEITVKDRKFELSKGVSVRGIVRNSIGDRVPGIWIHVGKRKARSSSQGEFSFVDLPAGELVFSASANEEHGTAQITVDPGEDIGTLEVHLSPQ